MTNDDTRPRGTLAQAMSLSWLRRTEKRRKVLKVLIQTAGVVLAGIGGAMSGDLVPSIASGASGLVSLKLTTLGFGLALLTVVGLMTLWDRDPSDLAPLVEELEDLRKGLADGRAENAASAAALDNEKATATASALRAQTKITLHQVLLQAVETASLERRGAQRSIQALLDISINQLLQALQIGRECDWTISVFERKKRGNNEAMVRVCQVWSNMPDTKTDRRIWLKNEGFTGRAWALRKPVVVHDAQSEEALKTFEVPTGKRIVRGDKRASRSDSQRYRSVAAFPIRIGPTNPRDVNWQPWGVLTITTDEPGLFSQEDGTEAGGNREIIRNLAALVALIVAGNG